jgi:hypothetical protein
MESNSLALKQLAFGDLDRELTVTRTVLERLPPENYHRGQLCLYLRLLNVPVPTVYFNTADDPSWVFA